MSEWVVLELGPMAEGEDPALIRSSIRSTIRDADVFVPALVTQVGEDRVVTYLVDGYAFVKRTHPDEKYFRLEDTRYVQAVVRQFGSRSRRLACVSDCDIDRFRRQIRAHSDQGIDVGDTVLINSGPYKNLQAVVVEDISEQDSVQVSVELRSKDSLITLPRSFLHLVSKAAVPPYVGVVREARAWFDVAAPVLRWRHRSFHPLRQRFAEFQQVDRWISKGRALQAEIRLDDAPVLLVEMRRLTSQHHRLTRWIKRGSDAQSFLQCFQRRLDPSPVSDEALRLTRLSAWTQRLEDSQRVLQQGETPLPWAGVEQLSRAFDLLQRADLRLLDIERAVRSIERRMAGSNQTENVVIDGMNMAVRCSTAPGLSELRDAKGRPTGAIVGFLNSLAALRRRHPEAEIWVCWDSPSTRRKALFPEYKANRNPLRTTFEVEWLKANLPSLGVWQAEAEGEEADDVVASLVRGRLADQRNLVVSNDRDFLQLVTDTTHVLVPAVGTGKERVCTPEYVRHEYGVLPEKMVHLRALGGDTSDNIPGAPGCGNKTAGKLIALYGTIDGIFVSSLAGHPPSLREKIRSAEKQVRLNLLLMTLVADLDLRLHAPKLSQESFGLALDDIGVTRPRMFSAFFTEAP